MILTADRTVMATGKVELGATRTDYPPNSYEGGEADESESTDLIATFDTPEMAQEYVNKNKLRKPIRNIWSNDEPYKRSSLLRGYGSVEIRDNRGREEEPVVHNPT